MKNKTMVKKTDCVLVAGATGLVGSAIVRALAERGYTNIVGTYYKKTPAPVYKNYLKNYSEMIKSGQLRMIKTDLTDQRQTKNLFSRVKPDFVFNSAARVGGIYANNTFRAEFIYENLRMQNNLIHYSYEFSVKKLLFLGSSCIYPKNAQQPINEAQLLTGELEYTNEPYALAKIAGIRLCESYYLQYGCNFISVMPTNLYGYNDNYDLKGSHVIPALIRKTYLASLLDKGDMKTIEDNLKNECEGTDFEGCLKKIGIEKKDGRTVLNLWGTGSPLREFMHVDDMADASCFLMENVDAWDMDNGSGTYRNAHINIGSGDEVSIKELSRMVAEVVGYKGELRFNPEMPDGTPRKLLDCSRLHSLGFRHRIPLKDGLVSAFNDYLSRT
ncbi:GDP-L-fucose synthase family protein [Seleniivibrio woodruffii]|uniref:GDP-L-fucose synthase n=1 Tax=Seleniivibrio woodruffii TaxID=1078050 RepID=A0A4R1KFE6_9BACT|nr:GDP-L-fucose synthase [Seleniivibrio woodruffii]TCK62029.1 GDP-L-fucose synthase [Seleniivibrio woodruffii]TVZ34854.1 GDP-L-fucose synthase [Seleniivibrio woodruffii]